MNIIQVGSYPPPYGGHSVHIQSLADFLNSHGYNCLVFNTGKNKRITKLGVDNIRSTVELAEKVWTVKRDWLIHFHAGRLGHTKSLLTTGLISMVQKRKLVVTLHSGGFAADYKKLNLVQRWLILRILRTCQCIISVNKEIEAHLLAMRIEKEKISTIPAFSLSVDLSRHPIKEDVQTFLKNHKPVLACMGFFEPQYGLKLALETLAELKTTNPDAGMVMMVAGKDRSTFMKDVESLKCKESVLVLENESRYECLSILSKCDLFLRPTLFDGDAISVREALALGTPVVASKTAFRPEGTAVFRIGDRRDLLLKIKECLSAGSRSKEKKQKVQDTSYLRAVLDRYHGIYPS